MPRETDNEETLPSPEERRRIRERARQVLQQAREVLDLLNEGQARISAALRHSPYGNVSPPPSV